MVKFNVGYKLVISFFFISLFEKRYDQNSKTQILKGVKYGFFLVGLIVTIVSYISNGRVYLIYQWAELNKSYQLVIPVFRILCLEKLRSKFENS